LWVAQLRRSRRTTLLPTSAFHHQTADEGEDKSLLLVSCRAYPVRAEEFGGASVCGEARLQDFIDPANVVSKFHDCSQVNLPALRGSGRCVRSDLFDEVPDR
jgi:hypothetical protein